MNIRDQLIRDEGRVLHAYADHLGYLTIGVGRLIDKRKGGGITEQESEILLDNDIAQRRMALITRLPWFAGLDEVRQGVLINMAFQLGISGLLSFQNTLSMIERGDYENAARAMLQSKWSTQTPERAHRLAEQLRDGIWI